MRTSPIFAVVLALAVAGCSGLPVASGLPSLGSSGAPPTPTASSVPKPSTAAGATPSPTAAPSTPTPSTAAGPPTPTAGPTATPIDAATTADIKAVIEKANQEQQDAFAKKDPTLMKDTATASHYREMVQINRDMANSGVSAIKLVKIEWGDISLTNPTTARATTFETWQATYRDGSTDQSRDENVYTLVKEQGAWKIQSDDHPNDRPSLPAGPSVSAPFGPGAPGSPASGQPVPSVSASQTDVSRNWAGYAATSGSFTGVTGTWTVPQPRGGGSRAGGATWVGIGGVRSRDLIQAGTMETTDRSGTVRYEAWVETLPQAARQVRLAVRPGDSVTVSISQQASDQWQIQINNNTSGESYRTTVRYASSLSSAEWIEEAPSAGRTTVPLDNFGTVQFSGGTAVRNGKSVTIAQSGAQPITMAGAGGAIASPSALTPDGQGFTVSRSTATPTPRIGRRFGA